MPPLAIWPAPGHSAPPLAIWAAAGNLCPTPAKYLLRGVHFASGGGRGAGIRRKFLIPPTICAGRRSGRRRLVAAVAPPGDRAAAGDLCRHCDLGRHCDLCRHCDLRRRRRSGPPLAIWPPPGHSAQPLAIWAAAGNLCPTLAKYLQRGVYFASGGGRGLLSSARFSLRGQSAPSAIGPASADCRRGTARRPRRRWRFVPPLRSAPHCDLRRTAICAALRSAPPLAIWAPARPFRAAAGDLAAPGHPSPPLAICLECWRNISSAASTLPAARVGDSYPAADSCCAAS